MFHETKTIHLKTAYDKGNHKGKTIIYNATSCTYTLLPVTP